MNAPPMVLVHGLQDCAHCWDFLAYAMRDTFHVFAIDMRGHGDTEHAGAKGYAFESYVSDLSAFIEELDLRGIVLIGHSAGGRYAFSYASRHPERVSRLVVVDIDPDAVNPGSRAMIVGHIEGRENFDSLDEVIAIKRSLQPHASDESLEHQAAHLTRKTADGRLALKRDRRVVLEYERPDLWEEWRKVKSPTLLLRGRESELLRHDLAVKMREALPHARLVELDGGGHWFHLEQPGPFESAIRWFLEGES
jgi:pimeloyl-ACP methyl ester carboxylesterase